MQTHSHPFDEVIITPFVERRKNPPCFDHDRCAHVKRKIDHNYFSPPQLVVVAVIVKRKHVYETNYLQHSHGEIKQQENEPARLDEKTVKENYAAFLKLVPYRRGDKIVVEENYIFKVVMGLEQYKRKPLQEGEVVFDEISKLGAWHWMNLCERITK